MLHDHGRVEAGPLELLPQAPDPALDLGGRSHVPYRNRRMILANGPVYTMDPRLPRIAALAVAGAMIAGGVDVREGDTDTVGHERIDLDGRCVVPGFTDAHVHFQEWALARAQLDLRGCGSKAEALRQVEAAGGTGWLRGGGWEPVRWPDGPVSAADLDAVTGDRPAALWSRDGHTLWLNSAALASSRRHASDRRPARERGVHVPPARAGAARALACRACGRGRRQRPRRRLRARLPAPRRPRPVAAARRRPPPAPARAHDRARRDAGRRRPRSSCAPASAASSCGWGR